MILSIRIFSNNSFFFRFKSEIFKEKKTQNLNKQKYSSEVDLRNEIIDESKSLNYIDF